MLSCSGAGDGVSAHVPPQMTAVPLCWSQARLLHMPAMQVVIGNPWRSSGH